MTTWLHCTSLVVILITLVKHETHGITVIPADGNWWYDDFRIDNSNNDTANAWYNPTVSSQILIDNFLGNTQTDCIYANSCQDANNPTSTTRVWGWWNNCCSDPSRQMSRNFKCASKANVTIQARVYFCIENTGCSNWWLQTFYFNRLGGRSDHGIAGLGLNNQQIQYNTNFNHVPTSENVNKPGTTCNVVAKYRDIDEDKFVYEGQPGETFSISISQITSCGGSDNAIAFNRLKIKCDAIGTSEPTTQSTPSPTTTDPTTAMPTTTTLNPSPNPTQEPTTAMATTMNGTCDPAICNDGDYCNGVELCVNNQCIPGTDIDCGFAFVCDSNTGKCIRDCNSFDIDGYLQCSQSVQLIRNEINNIDNKIQTINTNMITLNERIIDNDNNISRINDKINQVMMSIVDLYRLINNTNDKIDRFGFRGNRVKKGNINPMDVDGSSLSKKDVFMIGSVLINMIILFYIYFYQNRNINARYTKVAVFSDAELSERQQSE